MDANDIVVKDAEDSRSLSLISKMEIPFASYSKQASLNNLRSQLNKEKLSAFMDHIDKLIETSIQEGNFSCIVSNDMLEDYCSTEEEAFDDALIQYVVQYLRSLGYKVKYEELIYSDISNLIEINW